MASGDDPNRFPTTLAQVARWTLKYKKAKYEVEDYVKGLRQRTAARKGTREQLARLYREGHVVSTSSKNTPTCAEKKRAFFLQTEEALAVTDQQLVEEQKEDVRKARELLALARTRRGYVREVRQALPPWLTEEPPSLRKLLEFDRDARHAGKVPCQEPAPSGASMASLSTTFWWRKK